MHSFETRGEVGKATLLLGDLVQILGVNKQGDAPVQLGRVQAADYVTVNPVIPLPNGLKVEIFPAPSNRADGTLPTVQDRQFGTGSQTKFDAPHINLINVEASSFFVQIDGVTQRPVTDFTVTEVGKLDFTTAPPTGSVIDITFFRASRFIQEGEVIEVLANGSTERRTLGERFADVVNVKDFGAKGDGTADDTAAIQAALNAGKEVFFPSGTYLISSNLKLGDGHRVTGYGAILKIKDGAYTGTFLMMTNTQKTAPYDYNSSLGQQQHIHIEGLKFDANVTGVTTTGSICAIFLDQADFCSIRNVRIKGNNTGNGGIASIRFYFCNRCVVEGANILNSDRQGIQNYESSISVKDCYIMNSKERECILTSTHDPIQYKPSRSDIIRCTLLNTVTTNGSHVVRFSGKSDGSVRDCTITGKSDLNGVYITFSEEHDIDIQNNVIKSCLYGVLVETTGIKHLNLSSNRYECTNGFRMNAGSRSGQITLDGEVFRVTGQPMYIGYASKVAVSKCDVEGGSVNSFIANFETLSFRDNAFRNITSAGQAVNINAAGQKSPPIVQGNSVVDSTVNYIRCDGNAIVVGNSARTIGSGVHAAYLNDRYIWNNLDLLYISSGTGFPASLTDGIVVGTQVAP